MALNALGYLIFRGSNSQKNAFRQNPDGPVGRRLRTLQTATGRRLIVSGWWGVARHINYFGDWLLGCALPRLPHPTWHPSVPFDTLPFPHFQCSAPPPPSHVAPLRRFVALTWHTSVPSETVLFRKCGTLLAHLLPPSCSGHTPPSHACGTHTAHLLPVPLSHMAYRRAPMWYPHAEPP